MWIEKDKRYKKISQTHRQNYVFFTDLNNLGHFRKLRHLSHMPKVTLTNKCAVVCTVPNGVRCLKFGLNSQPQDSVSEHVYIIR